MRTIITYQCEICNRTYNEKESAENCEAKGLAKDYPVGLLDADDDNGFYGKNLAFAVAKTKMDGHFCHAILWACRDTPAGDSLGEETCGSSNEFVPSEFKAKWLKRPPVQRLIKWLRDNNINPLILRKGKIVPLEEIHG